MRLTKRNLGWPEDKEFFVPEEALQYFRQFVEERKLAEVKWQETLTAYKKAFPELAHEWERVIRGTLPADWDQDIPQFDPDESPMATRVASGKVLNAVASRLPELIGGSADLAPSNNTYLKEHGDFERESYQNRNLHFGIREHAMGATISGMALHGGVRPFGGTFLVFSDYMRPAVRLSSLMRLPAIYVFTHDSVGLGEDGPTHQSIEQLASLRAIPHLTLIRPGDANETAVAWRVALENRVGPVALILTRQGLPILDRSVFPPASDLQKGAYIIGPETGKLEAIIIATGSEVHIALEAWRKLSSDGFGLRLVNMPSWELFEAQDQGFKNAVLPPEVKVRVAVEAGSPLGWERYVGEEGRVIGINTFGASAPGKVVLENYGFTVENIIANVKALMK